MKQPLFTLPAPLSHFRGITGTAILVTDPWGRHGVKVTLETGVPVCVQDFSDKAEAETLVAHLNQCLAD